jgi:hypothetical protein
MNTLVTVILKIDYLQHTNISASKLQNGTEKFSLFF